MWMASEGFEVCCYTATGSANWLILGKLFGSVDVSFHCLCIPDCHGSCSLC